MDNNRVSSCLPKLWDPIWIGRGAFHSALKAWREHSGACGKANVGISNDKGGEKPPRRKTKVS